MWISQTSPEQSKQKPRPKKWFHESRTILRAPREKSENDKLFITALRIIPPDTHFYASIPIQYYLRYFYESDTWKLCYEQWMYSIGYPYQLYNNCLQWISITLESVFYFITHSNKSLEPGSLFWSGSIMFHLWMS